MRAKAEAVTAAGGADPSGGDHQPSEDHLSSYWSEFRPTVIDATIGLAWLFSDDAHDTALELIDRIALSRAVVPAHWWLEVANAACMADRRRAMAHDLQGSLATLRYLPIEIDTRTSDHAASTTLELAMRYRISVHDAAYVELARRRKLPLASLLHAVAMAAEGEGVKLAIEPLPPSAFPDFR